jgi:hypothetical protein
VFQKGKNTNFASMSRASVERSDGTVLVEVDSLLEWYDARDTLFGTNYHVQNVVKALELAAACIHPEARWLTSLFLGRKVQSKHEAREVFLGEGDEPRSLLFAAMLDGEWDYVHETFVMQPGDVLKLEKSANAGVAYAQSMMVFIVDGPASFAWSERAALQNDRDGLYWLASCFENGSTNLSVIVCCLILFFSKMDARKT